MRKLNISILVLIVFLSTIFLFSPYVVLADHEGPERIVEDKYVVSLSIIPAEGRSGSEMNLRFFFKDTRTGKNLEIPIEADVTAEEADTGAIVFEKHIEVLNGVGSVIYQFPKSEIYTVELSFEKSDEPGKIYGPLHWDVWVPGLVQGDNNYPLGGSEIAGFSILTLFLGVLAFNFWQLKQRKKKENSV